MYARSGLCQGKAAKAQRFSRAPKQEFLDYEVGRKRREHRIKVPGFEFGAALVRPALREVASRSVDRFADYGQMLVHYEPSSESIMRCQKESITSARVKT